MLSYFQACVLGLVQGITELFPVSSLGHSVLIPALIGGSWQQLVTDSAASGDTNPYLAFIVALHVATALALLAFFWRDWVRIIAALIRSLGPTVRARRIVARDGDERLAWLLVIGTIPVGLIGLAFEHAFRTLFAKPLAAAVFLTINGAVLVAGEWLRRRPPAEPTADEPDPAVDSVTSGEHTVLTGGRHATGGRTSRVVATPAKTRRLASLNYREGALIGLCQSLALFAGISRSGVTMVGGLARGLSHRDAARFAFLLATPVILAAGVLKLPTLAGPAGAHIRGPVIAGAVLAGIAAYLSTRFLTRWFETRTLTPFAGYCLVVGALCIVRFA